MPVKHQQSFFSKVIHSRITTVVLILVIILLGRSVYERYMIEQEISQRRAEAEHIQQQLKERKDTLENKVQYLSNERGIESEMRRHFDMAREGEQVVIILDDEINTEKSGDTEGFSTTTEVAPWYVFWR